MIHLKDRKNFAILMEFGKFKGLWGPFSGLENILEPI